MKYTSRFRLFVFVAVTTQVLGSCGAEAADELARRSAHPYLTYSDANIARLKERIRNEPAIADAWAKMLADANRLGESTAGRRGRAGRAAHRPGLAGNRCPPVGADVGPRPE